MSTSKLDRLRLGMEFCTFVLEESQKINRGCWNADRAVTSPNLFDGITSTWTNRLKAHYLFDLARGTSPCFAPFSAFFSSLSRNVEPLKQYFSMEMSSWNYIHELSDKVDNFKQLLTGVVPRTDFRGEYWLSGTYNNSDSGFKDACERVVAREFVNSDVGVNWITSNSAFERLAERQSAQRPKGIEFLGVFTEKSLLAFLLSFWHGGWSTSTRLAVGPDPGRPSEFQVFASGEDENPPSGCVFVNVQD